ncbi:MAG: hypothetical protein GY816_09340 [Cytophagales bacterium]|nr:hypothetical protein [Cytophagales bacterium]
MNNLTYSIIVFFSAVVIGVAIAFIRKAYFKKEFDTVVKYFIFYGALAVASASYLRESINSSIQQTAQIEKSEGLIIEKLKLIRDAELAYLSVNRQYTSDWDKLIKFVNEGEFFLTEKKETIFELSYGVDSIVVQIDTLGTVSVLDSLFTNRFSDFDASDLPFVPGYEGVKFRVWADKISKSGLLVDAIEVVNPRPVNPERDEDSEYTTKKPLRFGSKYSITTTGNWE